MIIYYRNIWNKMSQQLLEEIQQANDKRDELFKKLTDLFQNELRELSGNDFEMHQVLAFLSGRKIRKKGKDY